MPPLLAPILRERVLCIALLLAGIGMLAFQFLGWQAWECPFQMHTGKPCPGCGFTRATVALFQGDVRGAWQHHPFALLVLPAILVLLPGALAPEPARSAFVQRIETIERRTGLAHVVVLLFVAFGIWRMLAA